MPRPSPQTDRVRWIIRLLAAEPRTTFSLAQIARHLEVSKATCLPAVAALTSAGWLVRHPQQKTYLLGPALIEIGLAAEQAIASDTLVPALLELCDRSGTTAVVFLVSNDDLVLCEIVGPSGPRREWDGMRRGHRFRPVAPLGAVLVAWRDDEAVEAWLAGSGAADVDAARDRVLPGLAAVRERGFVVELQDHLQHELFQLIQRLRARGPSDLDDLIESIARRADRRLGELDYLAGRIDPGATYEPVSINAPVFDRYGDVEAVVCLVDVPADRRGSEVTGLGELVRDCACGLTARRNGQIPATWPTHG